MRATTLSYMGPNFEADTGDLFGTLAGLFGGGANAPSLAAGGGPGKTLGGLGAASIATALGMPQFAPMAASAGSMLGGLAQQGIETLTKPKPPKPRQLSRNERRIIDQGRAKAKQTGNEAFAQEAVLRVQRPAEYKRLRTLGKLPSQVPVPPKPAPAPAPAKPLPPPVVTQAQPAPAPPAAPVVPTAPTRPTLNLAPLFEGLNDIERAQLELAIQEGRGAETWNRIQAERVGEETRTQARTFNLSENGAKLIEPEPLPPFVPEMDGYAETSGPPDDRPRPKKHVAIIPLQQGQLEGILRSIPVLQKLDKRLIRLMAGLGSKARDVSGVDPKRGILYAEPGETPTGIAKRLTGRSDRVNELFAANPGNAGPIWQIPPGWLMYESDTGAIMAMRRYTVVQNDTPYKIAQKHGAFATRAKWWTELKQANPDKPTKDGGANWKSLYAGEEIGLPDVWFPLGNATPPPAPLPVPVPSPSPVPVPVPQFPIPSPGQLPIPQFPMPSPGQLPIPQFPLPPSGPGLPGPTQAGTQDPGVYLQAQALLALWARQNANSCIPSDYGANPTDFTGTATPRTTMALASFQAWWNRSRSSSPLRADGVLDEATYRALYSVTAAQIPTTPAPAPQPAPNPLPQLPPWLTGMLGGAAPPATPTPQPAPQFPPWFIPTTSMQNVPPWAVPSFPAPPPAPTPAPTPEPSTPDDGPAIPLMAMLGAGLFLS